MVRLLSFLGVSSALLVGLIPRELPAQSRGADSYGANASADATADTAHEPLAERFSVSAATEYLDRRPHAAEKNCFACHATFSYLPGRSTTDPLAREVMETRRALEQFVSGFVDKPAMPKRGDTVPRTQRVLAAVELARHDAAAAGHLQPLTRRVLDQMWENQLDDGSVDWSHLSAPPSEVDDYWGLAMMAVGAGTAPDGYASTAKATAGIEKLRSWFRAHPPVNGHERGLALLADQAVGGVLTEDQRKELVEKSFQQQLPDGGWSMSGLAPWKRPDGRPLDAKTSDGYGTAFMALVLCKAGVNLDDARLRAAVEWLKTHQRRTGGWYTPSPRKQDALVSYVGTSLALQTLAACGEIPAPKPSPEAFAAAAAKVGTAATQPASAAP